MINNKQIVDNNGNKLSISYFNEAGEIGLIDIKLDDSQLYVWEVTDKDDPYRDKNYLSQNGDPVKKVKKKYLNKYRKMEIINSLPKNIFSKIFSDNIPKKYFWDIETQSINGEFPEASVAAGKIYTHGYCDEVGNGHVLGFKPLSPIQIQSIEKRINEYLNSIADKSLHKEYKFHYYYYPDEMTMNVEFAKNHMTKMPCIFGWNVIKYDTQYFVNRCKNLNIDYKVISPKRDMFDHVIKDKYNEGVKYNIELPLHRPIIDYMAIFEAFDKSVKLKTSMSLDFISEAVLGIKKVQHSESFDELYEKDYEKFVLYQIIDTHLNQLIDQKCSTFEMMLSLANLGKVDILNASFASVIVENMMSKYYFDNYKKVFVKDWDSNDEKEGYSGGFVLEPREVGLKKSIGIMDYESLFPSIMQMLNIGEDTYVGRFDKIKNKIIDKLGNEIERDDTHIVAASGMVYTNTFDGAIRTLISGLFDERVTAKNEDSELEHEIAELKKLLNK